MPATDALPEIPVGKIAFVVTSLEMLMRPPRSRQTASQYPISHVAQPDLAWYRDLYRRVGSDWLWFTRLMMSDADLAQIVHDPAVEVYALKGPDGSDEGLLELDFRTPGECEIAYFGLAAGLIGKGAGRALMSFAIEAAWAKPIARLWVHTCTGDHPGALPFYVCSGFRPYRRQIEVVDDPRIAGVLPATAAPHVPMIRA